MIRPLDWMVKMTVWELRELQRSTSQRDSDFCS